jgi:streptomycin 6-kinase
MFEPFLRQWSLIPDGEPIRPHSSSLLPVRRGDEPAMLKIAHGEEERNGAALMTWWGGDGAARVLAREEDAILLERAMGTRSLETMSREGRDDEATRIICAATSRLHAPRPEPLPPTLVPLSRWFRDLEPGAAEHGGYLSRAAPIARELLAAPQDVVVLHGDVHHGNFLDFEARGWLAIDPKGLIGERGFDYVNLFRNPDLETVTQPGLFERRLALVTEVAGLDRVRLLMWIVAFTGLSAAWVLNDGEEPEDDLAVGVLAMEELERLGGRGG